LLQSAGKVILLSLESGRLEAELRSTTDELQTSRRRIVTIGEAERRKLERDLHDGAQQRLLAIQLKLALAREHAEGDELAEQLELIGSDAAAAAKELRELAHGIYPAVLLERGVAEALRSVAITAAIPVTVTDEGIGRCSPATEAAVYFCALEAIQNAAKHAGPGAHVTVTLARRPGEVVFAVADDGVGLADGAAADGTGVAGMHDRMGALGGTLEIATAPGRGTTVRGAIPE
jgi:signal transduction histidine kinase